MNVNFTGMQNVASLQNIGMNYDEQRDRIAIQLNNTGEKDLDNFKKILQDYPDSKNADFLDLEFKSTSDDSSTNVYINSKKLELNYENLPIFSKINNLLKRLSKGEEKTPVSERYLESKDCFDRYSSSPVKALIHHPCVVQCGAMNVQKSLVKTLNDFCTSEPKTVFSEVKNVGGFTIDAPDGQLHHRLQLELNNEDKEVFKRFLELDSSEIPKNELFLENDARIKPSNILNADLDCNPNTGGAILTLGGWMVGLSEKTLPVYQKLAEILAKMSKTKDEIPFSKDYLSSESLDKLSSGLFSPGVLETLSGVSDEGCNFDYDNNDDEQQQQKLKVDLVKSNSDAKYMAKIFLKTIDKQVADYFD